MSSQKAAAREPERRSDLQASGGDSKVKMLLALARPERWKLTEQRNAGPIITSSKNVHGYLNTKSPSSLIGSYCEFLVILRELFNMNPRFIQPEIIQVLTLQSLEHVNNLMNIRDPIKVNRTTCLQRVTVFSGSGPKAINDVLLLVFKKFCKTTNGNYLK
ncbi:unnamed protein product [Caretta caretta]